MDARLTSLPPSAWPSLVWAQVWQVTLLALVVWALVRTLGRDRPHLASVLWLVVLIKCITPPIVSSPAGVFCWLQPGDAREVAARAQVQSFDAGLPAKLPTILSAKGPDEASSDVVVRLSPRRISPHAAGDREYSPRTDESTTEWIVVSLAAIWLAGCVVYVGVFARRWLALCRNLRAEQCINATELAGEVTRLCGELGVRRRVRLLVTSQPIGPAVVGLWRPLIILPAALVAGKTAAELRPLLAHELVHIRRGDLWLALLQTLAAMVWWFHPLVRLASRLLSREAERCCDEAVIAHLGCDPAAYARSLLDVLALKQQLRPVPAFPGVRPLDVTSQRLERIMQLRQGCHKRTPWWCWLAMLALAVVVLPGGALLVEAQEKDRQSVVLPAARVAPLAPEPKRTQFTSEAPDSYACAYYVRELLARLEAEKSISTAQAKEVLAQLVQSSVSNHWPAESANVDGSKDEARLLALAWLAEALVITHDQRGHELIRKELKSLKERGFAELAIEVRIISGPAALLKSLPADWRFIGGTALGEDREASDAAAAVVERQLPAMVGVLEPGGVKALLDAAQSNVRTNILQAPKVTLFNGQFARIEDTVQRPFVVGVKPAADGVQEPQIRVVSEGMTIRLRPELGADDLVKLQFGLVLSAIESVDIASFPVGAGKEPISLQVPEVATTRIRSAVDLKLNETIAIQVPASAKRAKKDQPLCVLVTVRKVAEVEKAKAIAPPAAQTGRKAAGEKSQLVERIHAVADLVIPPPQHPLEIGVVSRTSNAWQELSKVRHKKESQPKVTADFESLVNLMETTIAPSSWASSGGEGSIAISASNFSLVIRQTADVHDQIADLLEQLRRLQDVQIVVSAEPFELGQAALDDWAGREKIAELTKFAKGEARAIAIPAAKWDAWSAKPQVDRQYPRVTVFNGQTFDLQLEEQSPSSQHVSKLRIQPVATADLQAVRMTLGGVANSTALTVPTDSLLLVDVDTAGAEATRSDVPTRRLCLIRSKILVRDRDTQTLTSPDPRSRLGVYSPIDLTPFPSPIP
jgi:beta-lactamase regulating signal transducer with metallopeptidase domain/type II secretory pathway component GspD/PulD (secretin)